MGWVFPDSFSLTVSLRQCADNRPTYSSFSTEGQVLNFREL
jgi:hypothetical protein